MLLHPADECSVVPALLPAPEDLLPQSPRWRLCAVVLRARLLVLVLQPPGLQLLKSEELAVMPCVVVQQAHLHGVHRHPWHVL